MANLFGDTAGAYEPARPTELADPAQRAAIDAARRRAVTPGGAVTLRPGTDLVLARPA